MSSWEIVSCEDGTYEWNCVNYEPIQPLTKIQNININTNENKNKNKKELLINKDKPRLQANCCTEASESERMPAIFQSGSGKLVRVKEFSIKNARTILSDDVTGFSNVIDTSQFQVGGTLKDSSIAKAQSSLVIKRDSNANIGCSDLRENQKGSFQTRSMLQNGLGEPVRVKQSSITKALSIFGDEGEAISDNLGCSDLPENQKGSFQTPSMFQNGLGKAVKVKQSSIMNAFSIFGDEEEAISNKLGHLSNGSDKGFTSPNSVFQTGSGNKVSISSEGLVKAKALLGLHEYSDYDNTFGTEQPKNQSAELFGWQNSVLERKVEANASSYEDATTPPLSMLKVNNMLFQSGESTTHLVNSGNKCSPIKFQSASGRSISVSNHALQRAKSLLGEIENGTLFGEEEATYPSFSFVKQGGGSDKKTYQKNILFSTSNHLGIDKSKHMAEEFVSPVQSVSHQSKSSVMLEKLNLRNNLIDKFDAEDQNTVNETSNSHIQQKISSVKSFPCTQSNTRMGNAVKSRTTRESSSAVPLGYISNTLGMAQKDEKLCGLKRIAGKSSVSPFKKPRNSRFIAPIKNSVHAPNGRFSLSNEESCSRRRISTHYPFQGQRKYLDEYFGMYPLHTKALKNLPDHVRRMSPENAEKYLFPDAFGIECIGTEAFYHMLLQSGASMQYTSKNWVANHYKWIVWKLACYERNCPSEDFGKLLTVNNVLQELKLRYEREVNHGHRSAIKRILEGDQPPSSELVLCISLIHSNRGATPSTSPMPSNNVEQRAAPILEVTDGWYSVNAFLDVHLSKKLAAGKIFVGQKLRICGAGLCGWAGPISPLEESSMVGLSLHINGTYRAHWASRLGLCKSTNVPLAFRCIKGMGGPVPCTLVGVMRIYPVQYRERLSNGRFIVRSGSMEAKVVQLYNQRRSAVADGIVSEYQNEFRAFDSKYDSDSEEGAKTLHMLETAAEPELIMAGMSAEKLFAFTSYKAKLEETRQSDMRKSIDTALEAAGLSARDVTPFMRVRVEGLTYKSSPNCNTRKGIITIWNPCDMQQSELLEGKSYAVMGLMPSEMDDDTLYLQARGSTTKWVPLSYSSTDNFKPFFTPRRPVLLSHLGEVTLNSEFDIAAFVIYVGDVYKASHQKKQWLFVADGTVSKSRFREPPSSLLAISFSSPCVDGESVGPVSHNLVGSAVGFCNLIKRAMDQTNHIWVAEASQNSTYFLNYDGSYSSHLKQAAASAEKWAKMSSLNIQKLRQKVLNVVGT